MTIRVPAIENGARWRRAETERRWRLISGGGKAAKNEKSELPRIHHREHSDPRRSLLVDEFRLAALRPWIVLQGESNSVPYGRMGVKPENSEARRFGLFKIRLAQDLI